MPANYLEIRPMDINRATAAGSRMGQSLGELLIAHGRAKARTEAMRGGDPGALAAYSPEEALAMQRGQLDVARTRADLGQKQLEAQRRRELVAQKGLEQGVERLGKVAQMGNEEAYAAAYKSEREKLAHVLGQAGVELPDFIAPDQLGQFGQDLRSRISETSDPKRYESFQREAASRLAADVGDQTLADPQFAMRHPEWRKYQDLALEDRQKRAPQTNITVEGNAPLSKTTETDVQKKTIGGMQTLYSLQKIQQAAKPEYFTLLGRAKGALQNFGAHIDPDVLSKGQQGDLAARSSLLNEVKQFFNAYRKEITGAAASEQELKDLEASILNPNMNWVQFQASLSQLTDKANRELRLNRRLMREGIPLDERLDRIAALTMSGDQGNAKDDIRERRRQLLGAGMNEQAVIMSLAAEGYITNEQASAMLERAGVK